MDCDGFKRDLHSYFEQSLSAARAAEIERHAAACGPCGELMHTALELSCRDFVAFLNDYIDGELAPERQRVFDRHVSICPDCTAYLDSYRKTMSLSVLALRSAPVPEKVPEDLIRAILDARR
jgi:anti-sigma factor RsiW